MSANPAVTPIGDKAPLQANQAVIVGRIKEVRRTENATITIIASPAPDAYSHPGQHEVVSNRMLGRPGDDVRVKVQLTGYRRSYQDKQGQKVVTVDNTLRAAEE